MVAILLLSPLVPAHADCTVVTETRELDTETGMSCDGLRTGTWHVRTPWGIDVLERWERGMRDGAWISVRGAQAVRSGAYCRDAPCGEWREWNGDGSLMAVYHYENGHLEGNYMRSGPDPRTAAEGRYADGLRVGEWREAGDDGTVWVGTYALGARVGTWRRTDGERLVEQADYADDRLHGRVIRYGAEGVVVHEQSFCHGTPCGRLFDAWPDGTPREETHYDLEGRLHGPWRTWSRDGRIEGQGTWVHGEAP